jgi:hypothetical protein
MVPGLEARLMSSSEEEVVFVADMVRVFICRCSDAADGIPRSKKELQVPGPMTPRA